MSDDDPFDSSAEGSAPAGEFETTITASEIAPEGICMVQLVNVYRDVSKSSGTQMWVWEFALISYVDPLETGMQFANEIVKVYTSLSKSAMWKMEETVNALGIGIGDDGEVKFTKEDVLGTVAKAVIKHSEFGGRIRAGIDALAAPDEGAGHKQELSQTGGQDADADIPF